MAFPITLPDARRQLRMEVNDVSRDDELTGWISDAASWVETYTGQIMEAREVDVQFAGCSPAVLKAWPIKPLAVATVKCSGADGEDTSFIGRLDLSRRPARVLAPLGARWPILPADQFYTVTVRAGYEEDDIVPGNLKRAMLMLISAYDGDREGGDLFQAAEASARKLCRSFRHYAL